jgi:[Skp1-protein]-hydroxyproline N-acetylglucosaminyltransferase
MKKIILLLYIFIIIIIILLLLYYFNKNNNPEILYKISNDLAKQVINNSDYYKPYINQYFVEYKNNNNLNISKKDNKIFVSVASYRDPQCSITINELISKADKPENLVIVICQQNSNDDPLTSREEMCDSVNLDKRNSIIKILKMDYTQARGPTYARYLIQQEWQGEQYYLQIDSHMRFVDSWDTKCINELNKVINDTNNNKICLSNYVSTYDVKTNKINNKQLRTIMTISDIDKNDGFPRFYSDFVDKLDKPKKSFGWSGCFSFSLSNIINDVPYEPYSSFIFFGEEMDILTRLISYGWEIYVPSIPICFTSFDRTYRKTFWENPNQKPVNDLSRLRYYIKYNLINNDLLKLIPKELLIDIEKYKLNKNYNYIDLYKNILNEKY